MAARRPPVSPRSACLLLLLLYAQLCVWSTVAMAASGREDVPPPPEGKVFRLAYLEAGPYWSYDSLLAKIQNSLKSLGWGDAVVFPPELHFSLGWDEKEKSTYESRVRQIFSANNFDLLLSFGTEASQEVVKVNPGTVPIVAVSITNPVAAGVVPGVTDSGAPNLTTVLNDNKGVTLFKVFYHILRFKSVGILYNDTKAGRLYAYLDDAREVGREAGFSVLEYDKLSVNEKLDECMQGVKELSDRGAEAIFISNLACVDPQSVDPTPLYDFLERRRIPTLAAEDLEQVRHFATLGILPFDEDEMSMFHARQIISILSGTKPGDLSMHLPFNFRLLVNLEAAQHIGLTFPIDLLMITDEIFIHQQRLKLINNSQ